MHLSSTCTTTSSATVPLGHEGHVRMHLRTVLGPGQAKAFEHFKRAFEHHAEILQKSFKYLEKSLKHLEKFLKVLKSFWKS